MTDQELKIRTDLMNRQESIDIMSRYNYAVVDGCQDWIANGGKLVDAVVSACRKKGLVQ